MCDSYNGDLKNISSLGMTMISIEIPPDPPTRGTQSPFPSQQTRTKACHECGHCPLDPKEPLYLSIGTYNTLSSQIPRKSEESSSHPPRQPLWYRNFKRDNSSPKISNKTIVSTNHPSSDTVTTVILKVSVSQETGTRDDKMTTSTTKQQQNSRTGGGNVTILNAANLDRDREHLISINTNNSDLNLHKHTIRVKNMPSVLTTSSDLNSKSNATTVTTNNSVDSKSSDRIVLQIHSSNSKTSHSNVQSNSSSGSGGHLTHNIMNNYDYASTVNPNVNFRKSLNHIESENNHSNSYPDISTVFSDSLNNVDYNSQNGGVTRCSMGPSSGSSSVYPDSDIISSSRSSSTRSATALIHDDDYLPTSLPHSLDDIINTNHNNNSKLSTAEVFANSISYPTTTTTTTKSNPHCPNCNGVVPLSHLDSISETAASKIDHGFWNHNYNNFHSNLHRESSFHSYGGFTLNGQPGYLKPNKHKMRKFCSSHKVAFVVSTFSILVTIGLIITLLLMKKKGMMEAMR